jgi:ribosomal-protein-alanine N-acetyltransferase
MNLDDAVTETITSKRLRLTPLDANCISETYLGWLNDPELLRYSENRHRRLSAADAIAYLKRQRALRNGFWAIRLAGNGCHVGNVTAEIDYRNLSADLGILVGYREMQASGLGTEAWVAVMAHLFAAGIEKIEAGTMATNRPMMRIFDRSCMVIEGVRPAHFLVDGTRVDLVLAGRRHDSNAS